MSEQTPFLSGGKAPPFTSLRAVEAAARHRSYTAAARELQITHAAISQAIKRLEQELDIKLFERIGQFMEPSSLALQMANAYSEATRTLYRSLDGILPSPAISRAVVAMPPDFGRLWFAPRLDRLSHDLPGLAVEVRTGRGENEDANVIVTFEPMDREGWSSEAFGEVELFPVCSPAFLKNNPITRPKDLLNVPLLAEQRWPWPLWLSAMGVRKERISHGHMFDDANMTLDAAVRGHGVALTHILHAEDYLRAGSLVIPLAKPVPVKHALYLNWRQGRSMNGAIMQFVAWMKSELLFTYKSSASFLSV